LFTGGLKFKARADQVSAFAIDLPVAADTTLRKYLC